MREEYKKTAGNAQAIVFAGVANGRLQINNTSITDELEKIYGLKQKGILTEDEFNNLKIKILNS